MWERSELVSTLLLPRWSYRWLLVLNDTTMYAIDKHTRSFVMWRPGICPKRDSGEVVTNKRPGGMGLHQVYRKWRTNMVTTVQSMLRRQRIKQGNRGILPVYTEVVTQLRARVPHQQAAPTRTAGRPTLFDEEDTAEEVAAHRQWTRPDLQRKYARPETWTPAPTPSPPPVGYRETGIAGYKCYVKGPMPTQGPFYSDGSRLDFYSDGSRLDDGRAGVGVAVGNTG